MIEIQETDPAMIANNLTPAYPTHPGTVLKEEIEYRKLSQRKLAGQMGISYKMLNDILNCRRPLTPTTALLFEAALGVSSDMLMRIQLYYNMRTARENKTLAKRLENIRKAVALL